MLTRAKALAFMQRREVAKWIQEEGPDTVLDLNREHDVPVVPIAGNDLIRFDLRNGDNPIIIIDQKTKKADPIIDKAWFLRS